MLTTLVVGIIIITGFVGFVFYKENSSLNSLSGQNDNLAQQVAVLEQRTVQVVTVTNTVNEVMVTTSISTETDFVTDTIYSTVTTTSDVYPPTSSNFVLTYVSGNSTETFPSCGQWTVAVDVTYEIHQPVPSNIIQWAEFPSGVLVQPSTQQMFTDQAYLTVFSTYSGTSGVCGGGGISSVSAFVTNTNNIQLSPSTNVVVQGGKRSRQG